MSASESWSAKRFAHKHNVVVVGRYTPAAGESVVGTILERHGEAFSVDINGPSNASLPVLAFESATVSMQISLLAHWSAA